MLLINCPFCGPRPELEFAYAGEAHVVRAQDPREVSDSQWTDYLYQRRNVRGVHAERWRHAHGCAQFFNALRDTTTDKFLTTYRIGETRPDVAAGAAR